MVNEDGRRVGLLVSDFHSFQTPPPASHLETLPEAVTLAAAEILISPFRSTKSMKISLEIPMCIAELASPPHQQPPSNPPRMIQLLNIKSVWHRTLAFKADGGFQQRGWAGGLFPNAYNTFNCRGLHCLLWRG